MGKGDGVTRTHTRPINHFYLKEEKQIAIFKALQMHDALRTLIQVALIGEKGSPLRADAFVLLMKLARPKEHKPQIFALTSMAVSFIVLAAVAKVGISELRVKRITQNVVCVMRE